MDIEVEAKSAALVLIDLQKSNVARQLAPRSAGEVVRNSARLADAVRSTGGTVIYVRVLVNETLLLPVDAPFPRPAAIPPDAAELVPEAGARANDVIVAKRQWGAFYGTDLEQQLRRRGIRTIILAGIATNIGVESTARAAFDLGYELVFAEDAMSSFSAEAHASSINWIFPRMGRVRKADQIVNALQ
jgi:nicotinamidase-related amidase